LKDKANKKGSDSKRCQHQQQQEKSERTCRISGRQTDRHWDRKVVAIWCCVKALRPVCYGHQHRDRHTPTSTPTRTHIVWHLSCCKRLKVMEFIY